MAEVWTLSVHRYPGYTVQCTYMHGLDPDSFGLVGSGFLVSLGLYSINRYPSRYVPYRLPKGYQIKVPVSGPYLKRDRSVRCFFQSISV